MLPFLRYDDWWIRGFDYPRMQLTVLLGLSALGWSLSHNHDDVVNAGTTFVLAAAFLYQSYRMIPYSPFWPKQVSDAKNPEDESRQLSIMVSNVLQPNDNYARLIELVRENRPDILLTVESNERWERALKEGIGDDYPHSVDVPLENLYGMHLFSKLALHDVSVRYRIKEDIPSIDCGVELGDGQMVDLYFLHPMPPSPSEDYASTGRDAELALVGKQVRDGERPAIVAGDMNDVAWSHSSRLFQRISGLLDPRRGRGLFATFHADYWFARWPLDHIFHDPDFGVVDLKRLPSIGSDHFPVYIKLHYEPEQSTDEEKSQWDGDEQEADGVIRHAREGKKDTVRRALGH